MGKLFDAARLIGARALVRQLKDSEYVGSGRFVRPNGAEQRQNRGIVEKVGRADVRPDEDASLPFRVGDLVFFQKYAGTTIDLDGADRLMLDAAEIQAMVPAEEFGLVVHDAEETSDVERRVRALDPMFQGSLQAGEHLAGDACQICFQLETLAQREEDAAGAKERLAQTRAEMVASTIGLDAKLHGVAETTPW